MLWTLSEIYSLVAIYSVPHEIIVLFIVWVIILILLIDFHQILYIYIYHLGQDLIRYVHHDISYDLLNLSEAIFNQSL